MDSNEVKGPELRVPKEQPGEGASPVSPAPYWDEDGLHRFTPEEGANYDKDLPPFLAIQYRNGAIVTIAEGTGHHAKAAQALAGGKTENVMPALMHLLCRYNGKQLPPEDWLDLPLPFFTRVQAEVNEYLAGN